MPRLTPAQRFDALKDRVIRETHLDANESAFVARALLYVEAETYDTELPPNEARKYIPFDNTTPPGAKYTAYRQYTRTGMARLITGRGQDLPRSVFFVKEFQREFYRVGMSYGYTLDDLLAAQMASSNGGPAINIDMEEAKGCMEGIERAIDRIAAFGSAPSPILAAVGIGADVGMIGVLNHPNIPIGVAATGVSTFTQWSRKSPDEIIADMNAAVATIVESTFKVHKPTNMLVPIAHYERQLTRSMGDGRSDTILSYFLKTNQHIKEVDSWQYLTGSGPGSTDQMLVFEKSKRTGRVMMAQEFTQDPVQYEHREYTVDCTAKTAGFVCPYPLAWSLTYGI